MSGRVCQGDNEDLRAEGNLAGRAEMAGAAAFFDESRYRKLLQEHIEKTMREKTEEKP